MATTTMTRWRPFAEFANLRARLDRLLEDMAGPQITEDGKLVWAPDVDLVRESDRLILRVDVPGIKPEEIKIELKDDLLTVSGEHEEAKEEKGKDFVRHERRYGAFSRSVAVPAEVDAENIEATCKDGVLEVVVPLPETERRRHVEIKPKAG